MKLICNISNLDTQLLIFWILPRELKKMDDVAYIRFASVYEDFQRVDDFRDAILEVKKPGSKRARRNAK